jgi:hypothetical protein
MKHKGERHIPDFSKTPKTRQPAVPDGRTAPAVSHGRPTQPKPASTSAKSGRRGQ